MSWPERLFVAHGGRVPPVHPSAWRRALELVRCCLFLPLYAFIWAVFIARIVYLVAVAFSERLTPSRPRQASAISRKMKKILLAIRT